MTRGIGWTDSELARLRLEGLDHLNRLRSGEASDQDAAAFVTWRSQSRAHEEAFRSAVRLQQLVRIVETRDEAPAGGDNVIAFPTAGRERHVTRRHFVGGAIAASAAGCALLLGRSMELVPSIGEALADYRTGTGGRRLVRLAGGATVDLNTRTSIDMREGLNMPAVDLVAGEAVLTSGGATPAALIAGQGTSVVRGGRLNARRDGDNVCVTCLRGSVEVSWAAEKRLLKVADEVRYDGAAIGPVTRGPDPEVLSAWQSGTLIFRNMPMREVIGEINRYRPGKVYLASERLASRSLSGTYFINRLDDFFSQAELGLGVRVTRLPGKVVVLS